MRRKQVALDLENDPLLSIGEQLGDSVVDSNQTNIFGEPKIILRPKPTA
jgi:hypothetical protein